VEPAGFLLRKRKSRSRHSFCRYTYPIEKLAVSSTVSGSDYAASRILVIDDDRKLCRLIADYLGPLGYDVTCAYTGPAGLELATRDRFEAVILDVMLPGMNGFEVLRQLRRSNEVPVLMLTARGDEADRIVGLELGADDYLPKTFSTRELLARLRAVTRRTSSRVQQQQQKPPREYIVRNLRVNVDSRIALLDDTPLVLTPVEFDILANLVAAKGRVKSREQLLESIAEREYEVFDRSIDVHISALRKKLGDDPRAPKFIRTVRAAGYMCINPDDDYGGAS
jgi:DNA-binding response OmpR family regulator